MPGAVAPGPLFHSTSHKQPAQGLGVIEQRRQAATNLRFDYPPAQDLTRAIAGRQSATFKGPNHHHFNLLDGGLWRHHPAAPGFIVASRQD